MTTKTNLTIDGYLDYDMNRLRPITTTEPETEVIDDPEEMETIETLDSDDFGTLYSVRMDHMGLTVSVYVTDEGEELFPSDWQEAMPKTCAEMADYEWYNGEEIDF